MSEQELTDLQQVETAVATERAPLKERLILIIIALVIILLDQWTKNLVESNLAIGETWTFFPGLEPFFQVLHTSNTGAAFGLFANGGLFFGIMAVIVSIAILVFNQRLEGGNMWLRIALGLQLGGAVGNLIDRIRIGHVTDFLDVGPWPFLFNIADFAIVSGTILLAWLVWRESREEAAQKKQAEATEANSPANQ